MSEKQHKGRIEKHQLLKENSVEINPPKRPSSPCLSLLSSSSCKKDVCLLGLPFKDPLPLVLSPAYGLSCQLKLACVRAPLPYLTPFLSLEAGPPVDLWLGQLHRDLFSEAFAILNYY